MTTINAYIPVASGLVTLLLLFANLYYVAKFRESVDIQRKTSQGALLMEIKQSGVKKWAQAPKIPTGAKIVALISLLLWIVTIVAASEIPALEGLG